MKQVKILTLLLLTFGMLSCNKNDDQATGIGDVLIVAKKSANNTTVYGLSIYAYTFSNFQSVKVVSTVDPGKTYSLKSNQDYKTNFYYETPDAEFVTAKPAASSFNFSAVFENGATNEFQDILSEKVLALPIIEKCAYSNTTKPQVDITWTPVSGADSYAINILDGTNLVFGSVELANTTKTYSISSSGGGWATGFTPKSGNTYTVKLFAFLYEPQGSAYNLQATSVSQTTVVWGD